VAAKLVNRKYHSLVDFDMIVVRAAERTQAHGLIVKVSYTQEKPMKKRVSLK